MADGARRRGPDQPGTQHGTHDPEPGDPDPGDPDDLVAAGRCWRRSTGEGPEVVLVHGTMDRSTSFGRVARALEADHRVVRYDRRGYGRSVALGPPEDLDQQVDDLLDVLGDGPAVVFGHSYGGTIALAAAARHPGRLAGVVAYESPQPWQPWWPARSAGAAAVADGRDPAEAAEGFMRRMVGDERWARLPPSTRAARRAEGPTMVAELAQLRPPFPPGFDAADLTLPVVAAHGTAGAEHHRRAMAALADAAPDAELVLVEGAGHGVHLTHAAEAADLVRRLEARVAQGPAEVPT